MKQLELEGKYRLEDDLLIKGNLTLKLGIRHRAKKGQAKRFIGYVDPSKPASEQYQYISSLYSQQGTANKYSLEHGKEYYTLAMTGINSVVIQQSEKEPVLEYKPPKQEQVA